MDLYISTALPVLPETFPKLPAEADDAIKENTDALLTHLCTHTYTTSLLTTGFNTIKQFAETKIDQFGSLITFAQGKERERAFAKFDVLVVGINIAYMTNLNGFDELVEADERLIKARVLISELKRQSKSADEAKPLETLITKIDFVRGQLTPVLALITDGGISTSRAQKAKNAAQALQHAVDKTIRPDTLPMWGQNDLRTKLPVGVVLPAKVEQVLVTSAEADTKPLEADEDHFGAAAIVLRTDDEDNADGIVALAGPAEKTGKKKSTNPAEQ